MRKRSGGGENGTQSRGGYGEFEAIPLCPPVPLCFYWTQAPVYFNRGPDNRGSQVVDAHGVFPGGGLKHRGTEGTEILRELVFERDLPETEIEQRDLT